MAQSFYGIPEVKLIRATGLDINGADEAQILRKAMGLSTPCAKTGACMNCKSPDTICCQFLITRFSRHEGRIHVILVNDSLGF